MLKKDVKNSEAFIEMLDKAKILCPEKEYVFIRSVSKYYWIKKWLFFSQSELMTNLMFEKQILEWLREDRYIIDYDSICFLDWWKEWCFNKFDRSTLLHFWKKGELDKDIDTLIRNVCWYKEENVEWLMKSILYKFTHINDFTIPAVVFFWAGWSWKWSFIKLLSTIFWDINTMANLWQRELIGNFDTYTGNKLIVEFAELSTNNTGNDYKILTKLKNLIWAEYITVNEKWVKQYQTNNIAWFFISSNSNKPLQLDDKDKGNRRFTIIRSYDKLENWKEINDAIIDREKVSNFLIYLVERFPKVPYMKSFPALDNEEKRELEELWNSEANKFWEWFEETFPDHESKIKKKDIDDLLGDYCNENSSNLYELKKYFWSHSKYPYKKIRIWENTYYWIIIPKKSK